MPSMTQTEGFDITFSPDYWPPTADCPEAIVRVSTGELVSTYYCGICRADECDHTRALRDRIQMDRDDEQMQDYAEAMDYAHSVTVGMG